MPIVRSVDLSRTFAACAAGGKAPSIYEHPVVKLSKRGFSVEVDIALLLVTLMRAVRSLW